ncbi:MAG: hypothetical protein AAF518_00640 [Spirochaetota bacterium]
MLIANPIYDVFFKYLLEDNEIAREFIGTIIGEEIVELTLQPQESTLQIETFSFTVLRMDFHAVIQTKEGKKNVLIEMQKGKYLDDLSRFRKYLGEQYSKDENKLPIITIYFLGYPLDDKLPAATHIQRDYVNMFTGEKLQVKNSFVESLTHDSYLIQIPLLKENVQSKLEALLSIFDQTKKASEAYILSFPDTLPKVELLQKIIKRLQQAGTTEELRKKAQIENEVETSFKKMAREIQEKDQAIQDKDQTIQEKDQTIQEKDQAIQEKDQTMLEQAKALQEQERIIAELKQKLNQ